MASRRPEGTALLVAGHGAVAAPLPFASALHTLGQIGEALLSTGDAWQIRRLTATAGARYQADRGTIKQHLDELSAEPARAAMVVLLGTIADVGGEPALVTGGQAREYPEDATLPLAWIRERLESARAEQLVAIVSARVEPGQSPDPTPWLRALGTWRAQHLICVGHAADGHPMVDTLLAGLCGDALDPRTGTVTMASLSAYFAERAHGAALQPSEASETLAQPPPLAGLWDVRRSQLSHRIARAPKQPAPESDDLTGTVLPGRFRLDTLVARGTFGTVYRARQLAVERDVAVKVLHADIDPSSEDGRLFVHEVRSVGRLQHSNVVSIHQADMTQDGRLFYAMELLDGRDLQQIAADGPLPRARAVELVRQLLAGLGAAHDAALVHADVKPANAIVVEREGAERLVLVDFGLARLRAADRPAESAGGTPAYMAPEQMHLGRVDARSDLFSAALTLVFLLTGWRRPNAFTLAPPFEIIEDADLRAVLERALAEEPQKRYQTARDFASALTGTAPIAAEILAQPPAPFRHLASFTEADRSRLHGREADLAALTEHALYRRSVIYTAPSGTGKTSMLRAGLVPRLDALCVHAVYLALRPGAAPLLAAAISPGAATIAEAVAQWHAQRGGKLVLVLDRLEAALGDDAIVADALGFDAWPRDADVAVILSIREDHLARLVARTQAVEPGIPIVRLPPLGPDGARAAIIGPLTEARLAIEPELLDALLVDLQRAAAAIGPQMGWGTAPAVFPPHLQLACSVLYEALDPGEATLTLAHYKRLGGFDAIVGEHLERVLDTELADGRDRLARDLFLALVTTANERAMRPEAELVDMVGGAHGAAVVTEVLEVLRTRGLLVRVRAGDGEPGWELAHDSLVPRVLAWIDRRDLARRRAVELVRYHLRRSRAAAPSLLGRAELRELKRHGDALAELDTDWRRVHAGDAWTPLRLVARSRQVLRREAVLLGGVLLALASVAGASWHRARVQEEHTRREESLRDRNMGRFALSLEPFDWDPAAQVARPVDAAGVPLSWELHKQDANGDVGEAYAPELVERGDRAAVGTARVEHLEAHGEHAFLVVARGACAPSVIPLRGLPGYTDRPHGEPTLHVRVPTCAASRADQIYLPRAKFRFGGAGEPPSKQVLSASDAPPEQELELPAFYMDRTEVTNAAFAVFSEMSALTGIAPASYPNSTQLEHAGEANKPVGNVSWAVADAYCRYLGKRVPSSAQWTRALRGPLVLADGSPNPSPRRNFPWGTTLPPEVTARIAAGQATGPADVGSFALDHSVEGVADLALNLTEWTLTVPRRQPAFRFARGRHWGPSDDPLEDFTGAENMRPAGASDFGIGIRCVSE